MASSTDTESSSHNPILSGLLATCGGLIGVGLGTAWAVPKMIPPAVGGGIAVALYKAAFLRRAPKHVRLVASLVLGAALGFALHVLLLLL